MQKLMYPAILTAFAFLIYFLSFGVKAQSLLLPSNHTGWYNSIFYPEVGGAFILQGYHWNYNVTFFPVDSFTFDTNYPRNGNGSNVVYDDCLDTRARILHYIPWAQEATLNGTYCKQYFCPANASELPFWLQVYEGQIVLESTQGGNFSQLVALRMHHVAHMYCTICDVMYNEDFLNKSYVPDLCPHYYPYWNNNSYTYCGDLIHIWDLTSYPTCFDPALNRFVGLDDLTNTSTTVVYLFVLPVVIFVSFILLAPFTLFIGIIPEFLASLLRFRKREWFESLRDLFNLKFQCLVYTFIGQVVLALIALGDIITPSTNAYPYGIIVCYAFLFISFCNLLALWNHVCEQVKGYVGKRLSKRSLIILISLYIFIIGMGAIGIAFQIAVAITQGILVRELPGYNLSLIHQAYKALSIIFGIWYLIVIVVFLTIAAAFLIYSIIIYRNLMAINSYDKDAKRTNFFKLRFTRFMIAVDVAFAFMILFLLTFVVEYLAVAGDIFSYGFYMMSNWYALIFLWIFSILLVLTLFDQRNFITVFFFCHNRLNMTFFETSHF
jgi:hypothetical protein